MARKLRGFERVLDAPSLFAVAYGEIASSLYVALGIVAAQALGLTPLVLLLTGVLFLIVSLSYAEGTAALPETGGAATFVRRAFNDLAGFVTGWALFLDFLIVMALSALFMPHYLGAAISAPSLRDAPWDALIGCLVIAAIAAVRLARRTRLHTGALAVAILDLVVQGMLVLLGAAFLLSPETLREGLGFASGQEWGDLAFALPLAMLAYTGLETAANLAEEAREPGRTLPRSLFSAIGLVVLVTVLIAAIGMSAYPAAGGDDGPRRRVARGAARRHRLRFRGRAAGAVGRRAADGGRDLRSAHAARRGDDVGLGHHASHPLARRARLAPARVRPPRAPCARLERGDPDRGRARDRRDRGQRGRCRRRPGVPRERVLVRCPARVHGRAARRHLAPRTRACAHAAVQSAARGDASLATGSRSQP